MSEVKCKKCEGTGMYPLRSTLQTLCNECKGHGMVSEVKEIGNYLEISCDPFNLPCDFYENENSLGCKYSDVDYCCTNKEAQLEALKAYSKDELGVELVEKKVCKYEKLSENWFRMNCGNLLSFNQKSESFYCPYCGGEIVEV